VIGKKKQLFSLLLFPDQSQTKNSDLHIHEMIEFKANKLLKANNTMVSRHVYVKST